MNYTSPLMDTLISFPEELRRFRFWLTVPLDVTSGRQFRDDRPKSSVTTDASLTGWGATWSDRMTSGQWTKAEWRLHINVLETEAVYRAVSHWAEQLSGHVVTMLSSIHRQGRRDQITEPPETWDLLLLDEGLYISLRASHLAGRQNVRADALP